MARCCPPLAILGGTLELSLRLAVPPLTTNKPTKSSDFRLLEFRSNTLNRPLNASASLNDPELRTLLQLANHFLVRYLGRIYLGCGEEHGLSFIQAITDTQAAHRKIYRDLRSYLKYLAQAELFPNHHSIRYLLRVDVPHICICGSLCILSAQSIAVQKTESPTQHRVYKLEDF